MKRTTTTFSFLGLGFGGLAVRENGMANAYV
jgi:hypothetical protein